MKSGQFKELLLQALEHERGGVLVFESALRCVLNRDLRREWNRHLDQARQHVEILTVVCTAIGIDPTETTQACDTVRHLAASLVTSMEQAFDDGHLATGELVACDCVVLMEVKGHANWELIHLAAAEANPSDAALLYAAHDQVEDQQDEHLYHARGWSRELWRKALGLEAALPPPERSQDAGTAIRATPSPRELRRVTAW